MIASRRLMKRGALFVLMLFLFSCMAPVLNMGSRPVLASGNLISSISAGGNDSFVTRSDGTAWAWGNNNDGELATGDSSVYKVPVKLPVNAKAISAGLKHVTALMPDGTVTSWGDNTYGQLGDSAIAGSYKPVAVQGLSQIKQIACGSYHTLALQNDGTVVAWGNNGGAQLGNGTTTNSSNPVTVTGLSGVKAIAAGDAFSLALKEDGTVWAWGLNNSGQLGEGSLALTYKDVPAQVINLTGVAAIAAGSSFAVALKSDGTVWAWGYNGQGQLGTNVSGESSTPVQVQNLSGIIAIAAGSNFGAALKGDGSLWMWGDDQRGELGISRTLNYSYQPVQPWGITGVAAIAAGYGHILAYKSDGTLWAWGANSNGQLDMFDYSDRYVPLQLDLSSTYTGPQVVTANPVSSTGEIDITLNTPVEPVTVNASNIVVLDGGGNKVPIQIHYGGSTSIQIFPAVWYDPGVTYTLNIANLIGLGSGLVMTGQYSKSFSYTLTPQSWENRVSGGAFHSLAIGANGQVFAWGDNSYGQAGDGSRLERYVPVPVPGLSGVFGIAAGGFHSLALTQGGSVLAWGDNQNGQLGQNSTLDSTTPETVSGLSNVVEIAAGYMFSLALKSDGTVWAWGANESGQLGNGTAGDQLKPVQIPGLSGIIAIAAGSAFGLALKNDGTVWAWGDNQFGQLGTGDSVPRLIPAQVEGLNGVLNVSGGGNHSLALKNDGTVWAWGDNRAGQLGTGNTDEQLRPVQVQGLAGVQQISAGYMYSLALKGDNNWDTSVWAWGDNRLSQSGNAGSDNLHTSPVQVNGMTNVLSISAGGFHGLALKWDQSFWAWGYNSSGQVGDGSTYHRDSPAQCVLNQDAIYYRLAGANRDETAIAVSQEGWTYGAKAVILARDDDFPDALTSVPLAYMLDAPILLTNPNSLNADTKAEIDRLHPDNIYILGSTAAISSSIEQTLQAQYNVTRLGGKDRFETAANIALFLKEKGFVNSGQAVVAYGLNFPDALAISSLAAQQHLPILLTQTDSLPDATKNTLQALGVNKTIVVGSSVVISDQVAAQLPDCTRYGGANRYETDAAIVSNMKADTNNIFVATGENFPDALAGAALAARTNSPIILVDNRSVPGSLSKYLGAAPQKIKDMFVLGSSTVVSDDYIGQLGSALN